MNVFQIRRREPRVKLCTRAQIVGQTADGLWFEVDVRTIDVSPHGAAVSTAIVVPVGSTVHFVGVGYPFRARARIVNVAPEPGTDRTILGIEYLDASNPLVIWAADCGPGAGRLLPPAPLVVPAVAAD